MTHDSTPNLYIIASVDSGALHKRSLHTVERRGDSPKCNICIQYPHTATLKLFTKVKGVQIRKFFIDIVYGRPLFAVEVVKSYTDLREQLVNRRLQKAQNRAA